MSTADVHIQLPERYRVVRHVANGGMASVWAAEDAVLGRLVAVKVLASHVAAEPSARKRFEREARTAARVSDHPNVATIYDVGEHDGTPFIVMELFSGGSVADRLAGSRTVPRRQALAWLEQAAAALDYAHAEDIVHRDVKPANLLLDDRDRLAVGDFGIARIADDSNLTQAGQVLGTAAYLSPEQATGKSATAASDRYALGVVGYELLCGHRPFQGEHIAAQARQHVEDEVPTTELGPELDEVLRRAMAKDPDERYPTAARFVEELRAVADRTGAPVPPTEATRRVAPSRRQQPIPPAPDPTPTPTPTPAPAPRAPRAGSGGSDGSGRNGWRALGALAAVAVIVALVALFAGGGDGDGGAQNAGDAGQTQERQSTSPEAAAPQAEEETPAPQAEEEQPEAAAPDNEPESGAGPTSEGNESPSQLDARGYQLLQSGQAAEAVPLLEQAVKGFESQGDAADPTGYGYALYNLGSAYMATDRPDEAIPLFERRLEVSPDDRPQVVRKSLKEARKAAGQ